MMSDTISNLEMEIEVLGNKLFPENNRKRRIEELVEDLRTGRKVTDFRFDQIFSAEIRNLSQTHWTPVEVAIQAAELLDCNHGTRVLDVGSGCGKFCIVAALSVPGEFIGIEQRPHLVDVAQGAATELGLKNAVFILGNMTDLDWSCFDGFYLFNPFYEHMIQSIRIDTTLSYNRDKFTRYVEIVRSKLRVARPGTKVVTYHGFGGDLPLGYEQLKRVPAGSSYLELWVKMDGPLLSSKEGEK